MVNATRCRCVNLIQSEVVIIPMVPMSSIEGSAGSYLGVSRFLEVEPFDGGRERGEIPSICRCRTIQAIPLQKLVQARLTDINMEVGESDLDPPSMTSRQ